MMAGRGESVKVLEAKRMIREKVAARDRLTEDERHRLSLRSGIGFALPQVAAAPDRAFWPSAVGSIPGCSWTRP